MRHYLFVLATVVVSGCGKSNDAKEAPAPAGTPATPPVAAAPTTVAATPPPPPMPDVQACSLLAAADVGTIFGKTVVSSGSGLHCTYGIDPAVKQKQLEALQGGVAAMSKKGGFAIPAAISEQLVVDVELSHNTDTEDQVKAIYANIGKTVNETAKPEQHGLDKTIQVAAKDLPNVGDWAFSTNVAAVNMGMGMSTRGRLVEAKQGAWRLTISATVAPDPGEAKMDTQLGDVARGVFAKLK
jgi:hypothetical protein